MVEVDISTGSSASDGELHTLVAADILHFDAYGPP